MKNEDSPRNKNKSLPPKKNVGSDWEGLVEKKILEAMERGEFEDLPGRGKPLDLELDPNTPREWDLAFKLLKEAGFAPAWIEQDKEIRSAKEKLFKPLQSYLRTTNLPSRDREVIEARLIAEFRKQASELNRKIDDFNLQAPSLRVHHKRIRIDEEVIRFKEGVAKGRG